MSNRTELARSVLGMPTLKVRGEAGAAMISWAAFRLWGLTASVLVTALLTTLLVASPASAFDCPKPTEGPRDIKAMGYYSDAAKSVVDETLFKQSQVLTEWLDGFNRQIADLSDAYLAHKDAAAGACAVAWLDRWARDGAMLGEMVHVNNDQSDYLRQWVHAGAAIAYLKVEGAATADQRARIQAWLTQVSGLSLAYWDNPKKHRNNHYYWTGVGVMATALATGDAHLLAIAKGIYQKGVDDIADDGGLPMEMARGERAFHYHNYALAPLALIAEMARRQGQDWYGYGNRRLDLLAERVATGYRDPSWFAQQSGVAQSADDAKPTGETGWVEFYRLQAPHPEVFDALHAAGPFRDPRAGGNLTLMAELGLFDPK
jgi:poly(beta-D-mannuronate) lyase